MTDGALSGLKIIDLSRVLAGPYCSMILGDLGAEVIKIEAPGGSDDTRQWGPPFAGGESAYYLCANRNKKAITLNLKEEKGRDILRQLIAESDVLLHNFKTGTMEKWGLSYPDLEGLNNRLIYCGISGFGQTGPYKQMPGYDFVIQAMSGLMSITGSAETEPFKVGVAITDVLTGLYANIAIQAALIDREKTGLGQEVDLSLYDSAVSAMVNVASNYLISGKTPQRLGNKHPNIVPYQTFQTADLEVVIAVGNDGQFRQLCQILGVPKVADDVQFATNPTRLENQDELERLLQDILVTKPAQYWLDAMKNAGIPCGPIQTMDQVFSDPQVIARDMLVDMEHPTAGQIPFVGSPLKLSRTPVTYRTHPPLAGEHTAEVLQGIGFTAKNIDSLRRSGII